MGSEDESIEQKSAARKEALRALRAAKELSESKEEGGGDDSAAVEEEWVCFVLFLVYWSRALSTVMIHRKEENLSRYLGKERFY